MNLQRPNSGDATHTSNCSRDIIPCSRICTICVNLCEGNCEIFKATPRGREVIYPGPFGEITAGGNNDYPIDYSHLNIHGYILVAEAIEKVNPDIVISPKVETDSNGKLISYTGNTHSKISLMPGTFPPPRSRASASLQTHTSSSLLQENEGGFF